MPPDELPAARWLRQAGEDLHAAREILADDASPPRLACFLAHLAAEKALKGLLVASGRAVPRIHALPALAAELPAELQEPLDRAELEELTPWAIAGRYGDELAEADAATAARLVEAAERVLRAARAAIGESG